MIIPCYATKKWCGTFPLFWELIDRGHTFPNVFLFKTNPALRIRQNGAINTDNYLLTGIG